MEALRDQRGWPWLDDLRADVRIGLRMPRRNPLLMLTATVSIALGIGVNSVLFMYADAYMLRPLPVADADAVVTLRASTVKGPRPSSFAYANYRDLRGRLSSFEGLIARQSGSYSFARARQDSREMRVGMLVSDNFFDVLGVGPERGRTFGPDEGVVPGRDPVVVLSHDFWETVLDADDSVLDDVVWLNGVAFTVIGVTEESFTGIDAILRPAFYVPAVMVESLGGEDDLLESRTGGGSRSTADFARGSRSRPPRPRWRRSGRGCSASIRTRTPVARWRSGRSGRSACGTIQRWPSSSP